MSASEQPFTDLEEVEEVEAVMAEDAGPAVIDFWSPTCGPCKAMAPAFAAVAEQFEPEELRFYKINTGSHPHLAAPFRIRAVPTILFVHRGEVRDAIVGAVSAKQLGERSEWLLAKSKKRGLLSRLLG